MPLNKQSGEIIGDLGTAYRVVPMAKYVGSPFLEQAADEAYAAFRKAGACILRRFKDEDVLIQEYPQTDPRSPPRWPLPSSAWSRAKSCFQSVCLTSHRK